MSFEVGILLFLLGLAFGSFLNVVSLRYHPEKGGVFGAHVARGRSRCLFCQKTLSWYELIPLISFVIQKGKCRSCLKTISWQYPLVELASALLFVFIPLTLRLLFPFFVAEWGWGAFILASALWILVFLLLILVFVIDLKWYVIPNVVNGLLLFLGAIWAGLGYWWGLFGNVSGGSFLGVYAPLFFGIGQPVLAHLFGGIVAGVFFFLIVALSKGRAMGMGDVKLIIPLGVLFGWPDILLVMFLSFVVGSFVALLLMAFGKKRISDRVPFGPFIVIASAITFFWGAGLLSAYFGIIGM